jgi:Domain of unknown function (DUF5668)
MRYRYNSDCSCARCRAHGFMGPAVLITLGVLFLLDQMGHTHWMDFSFTWPALLIVIGLIKLLEHNASAAGHIPRPYPAMPVNPGQPIAPGTPGYPPPPTVVTPVPAQPAGFITPGTPVKPPDDRGGA